MENTIKTDIVAEEVIALMDKFNAILKTIKIGEDYFRHANYILEQMKDPGSYRPIKSINDVVDRGRFYNASTGQWCTREIKGERGREKATDYTKKTSTTLSARDGRIALFNHNNPNVAGFIFDRSKCIIKPKYIFPSNANTDQRWWIKKTNTDEKEHQMVRAIDFDDLCKEIDAVRSQGKVPKQNELLARLRSDSIVGVFSVSDNHKDRCAASFMRAMVYDQLNVVVPLFIVTQSDGIQIYDQQRQVQDLHKSLMLPKKTREYFYATYVLKKFPELSRQMVGRVESPPVVEALPTELSSVVLSYLGEESLKKVICRAIDSDQFSENNETLIEGAIRFFLNTGRESHVNFITSQLIRAVKKKSFFSGLISVFIKHKVHVLLSPEDWDLFQLHLIRFGRPDDFDRFAKYRPLVLSSKIKISLFETYSIAGEKPYIGRKFNISLHNLLTMSVLYNPESYAYFKRNFDSSHVLDDLLKLKLKNEDRFINNSSYYWVWSCGGAKFRSDITIDKKLINDAEQVALNHINDPAYYDNFYDAKVEGKACDNVNSPLLASAYNDQLTAVQYHQQRQQLDYQIKRVLNHSYPNSAIADKVNELCCSSGLVNDPSDYATVLDCLDQTKNLLEQPDANKIDDYVKHATKLRNVSSIARQAVGAAMLVIGVTVGVAAVILSSVFSFGVTGALLVGVVSVSSVGILGGSAAFFSGREKGASHAAYHAAYHAAEDLRQRDDLLGGVMAT